MRVALLTVALTACGQSPTPPAPGRVTFAIEPTAELDLLFMVDDSPANVGQMELRSEFPALLFELAAVPGGTPDLHVGVISSDLGAGVAAWLEDTGCQPGGDAGVLRARPSCGLPDGVRFASLARGAQQGPLALTFDCLANLGLVGCGFEHQLASLARALDPATIGNAGFLRPDAHLAIVLLTDEDDCSAPPETHLFADPVMEQSSGVRCAVAGHRCRGAPPPAAPFSVPMSDCTAAEDGPLIPVQTLVDRVRASKKDWTRQLTVAAIYGVPAAHPDVPYRFVERTLGATATQLEYESTCDSKLGTTALALRIPRFVEAFGAAGSSHDLCVDDLLPTLTRIGRIIAGRLTSLCLPAPVSSCQVMAGSAVLPRCGEGAPPCWRIDTDPRCPNGLFFVENAGALPAGTRITGCASRTQGSP